MISDYVRESGILKALAHPARLKMAEGLMRCECNVDKMVRSLKIPQSTASQHLAILKSRNIVKVRKDGVRTCYRVIDPKVKKIIKILSA